MGTAAYYYLFNDHLGSASTMTTTGGSVVEQARFRPFGEQRPWSGAPNSAPWLDRGFTGHLHNDEVGLIYMNARYYVPSLGRFASADTIVPNAADPQAFNRFSYVRNNPLNLIDPTGHLNDCSLLASDNDSVGCNNPTTPTLINFSGNFSEAEKATISHAALKYAIKLAATMNSHDSKFSTSATQLFLQAFGGPVTFSRQSMSCQDALNSNCYAQASAHEIKIFTNADGNIANNTMFVLHELTHSFNANAIPSGKQLGQGYLDLEANPIIINGTQITPGNGLLRTADGYRPPVAPSERTPYRQSWQDESVGEDFADMGANWVNNSFAPDVYGQGRYNWMNTRMPRLITVAVAYNQ